MRAVLVGLVGAVLAVGGARAGTCDLSAPLVATSRAQWASDLQRPDLAGKTFKIEKVASAWEPNTKRGYQAFLLSVGDERFVAVQSVDLPADHSESFSADDPRSEKIAWGKRDKAFEAKGYFGEGVLSDTGPLAHLYLAPKC